MRQRLSATGTYFGLPYEGDMEEGYAAVFRGEIDKALELLRDGQKRLKRLERFHDVPAYGN